MDGKRTHSLPSVWPLSLRIAAAALGLILSHAALLVSAPWAEQLLKMLSRTQFLPAGIAIATASVSWLAAGFLPVLLATALLGRIYCSVLCPLGITQDILVFLGGKIRRRRFGRSPIDPLRRRLVHLAVAMLSIVSFAAGLTLLVNLLEPYAFWGRMERDLILPAAAGVSLMVSEGLKLIDLFVAPIPFHGHLPVVAVTAALFIALLSVTLWRGRWFCNTLCPTGALLRLPALVPGLPLLRIHADEERCTLCGVCEKVCKTGSIAVNADAVRIDVESCVVCFVCSSGCPFDALRFSRPDAKGRGMNESGEVSGSRESRGVGAGRGMNESGGRRERGGSAKKGEHAFSTGRREFLKRSGMSIGGAVGGTSLFTAVLPGTYRGLFALRASGPEGRPNRPATPPGSKSLARFHATCISCHTCVAACPTHVLQPSLFEYGLDGFMQPVMDYGTGYCEFECSSCLNVCPVGAILPLSLKEKQKTQIGKVQFIKDRCVIFSQGTACGACAEVCPTGAVWMVPYRPHLTQPETDNDIGVGCGNCEYACPVEGGKAIYVRGNEVHVEREVREKEKSGPELAEPEEFPF